MFSIPSEEFLIDKLSKIDLYMNWVGNTTDLERQQNFSNLEYSYNRFTSHGFMMRFHLIENYNVMRLFEFTGLSLGIGIQKSYQEFHGCNNSRSTDLLLRS